MERSKAIKQVSIFGFLGNIFLLAIKLLIGFSTGSQAMIADGLNSAGDVFSSIMTYIGNAISSKPDDRDHPYGHGKAEYIFAFVISFTFFLVAFTVLKNGIANLFSISPIIYSKWLIIVAIITLIVKTFLFIYAKKIGKEHNSLLVLANAHDHRNDLFITSLTLVSIICSYYQIFYVDAIVAILISLWLGYTGYQVLIASFDVLMDRTLDDDVIEQMKTTIRTTDGVDHIDSVVARPIGTHFLILIKVSVNAYLTVEEGHIISMRVKSAIMEYEEVADVIVHINPTQMHPQKNYLK